MRAVKLVRTLRLFRLFKLIRLFKFGKLSASLEDVLKVRGQGNVSIAYRGVCCIAPFVRYNCTHDDTVCVCVCVLQPIFRVPP